MFALLQWGTKGHTMTPDFHITDHLTKVRFERLQTWIGVDRESEWFTIPATGIGLELPGVELRAVPNSVRATISSDEVRIRAVFRVEGCEARVTIDTSLSDGGLLTLRDSFGVERLQVLPGRSRLHADLSSGRYSIDAVLLPTSKFSLELSERAQVTATRRAQVG
ncbi:MAG: hypothetical protein QM516_04950 [Limnohabitans sp.]|nr:hypothetical protein [Limnohabitans sp.]